MNKNTTLQLFFLIFKQPFILFDTPSTLVFYQVSTYLNLTHTFNKSHHTSQYHDSKKKKKVVQELPAVGTHSCLREVCSKWMYLREWICLSQLDRQKHGDDVSTSIGADPHRRPALRSLHSSLFQPPSSESPCCMESGSQPIRF